MTNWRKIIDVTIEDVKFWNNTQWKMGFVDDQWDDHDTIEYMAKESGLSVEDIYHVIDGGEVTPYKERGFYRMVAFCTPSMYVDRYKLDRSKVQAAIDDWMAAA